MVIPSIHLFVLVNLKLNLKMKLKSGAKAAAFMSYLTTRWTSCIGTRIRIRIRIVSCNGLQSPLHFTQKHLWHLVAVFFIFQRNKFISSKYQTANHCKLQLALVWHAPLATPPSLPVCQPPGFPPRS